ncbi:MAG: hypothetical protein LH481_17680 [Burkholderiales bacterium]|nr:hypothetical protein [Burkholderiales bacterium]
MNAMNIQRAAAVITLLAALTAAGCTDKPAVSPKTETPTAAQNDPRAKVVGVAATGEPAKETPGTTSAAKSDVSKAQAATAMPLPGQANDHSTLSPKPSQKAPTSSTGAPAKQ